MTNRAYIQHITIDKTDYSFYSIALLEHNNIASIERLPYSIRILVENILRKWDDKTVTFADVKNIATWKTRYANPVEIPFHPARVLMQDFTGVPAVVDLASMRDAVNLMGGDPTVVNPLVPVELVIDHSIQIDHFGTTSSLVENVQNEYRRNHERYKLLKWAQKSFSNFKVVPPNSGICHQVNLEFLGRVIIANENTHLLYPDTLVGLDSHTPMINSIGVMGWGVGGIEAEAVMLGEPYSMAIPEVVGVHLTGALQPGVTATDLVLTLTELLRQNHVVEKFVEYFGPGMSHLSIPDRATIANMTPEHGATLGFFPIDQKTIDYLQLTGRTRYASRALAYAKANRLFYHEQEQREYSQIIECDLGQVSPSLAGPARPQDRISLSALKPYVNKIVSSSQKGNHFAQKFPLEINGQHVELGNGSIVIAAITSCTNTSNPHVLIGAGLMAKKAVSLGLHIPPYVKTSFAPGSLVVQRYLDNANLMPYFQALGFHIAAFGCTTCIGNSGPLHEEIEKTIAEHHLNVTAILSGNRNFEARIHQKIQSNFLASPMLVLAFALAGRIDIDMQVEPLGHTPNGDPVFLRDIWPNDDEIFLSASLAIGEETYKSTYSKIFDGDAFWQDLNIEKSTTYPWDKDSTYIKNPPYFENFQKIPPARQAIENARIFLILGDSVTTDHISPAGEIPETSPAGVYLRTHQIEHEDFNSYGSRRGNHEIMMRGTFANIRIKNKLMGKKEGGYTLKFPGKEEMSNFEAAKYYQKEGTPLIVMAGHEYGTGSSRDWAAKGTNLLGVVAVIAQSFERIHRNNLIGMGVLPLVFLQEASPAHLGITGEETFTIQGLAGMVPRQHLTVMVKRKNKETFSFQVLSRLDTPREILCYQHGGILPLVLRSMIPQGDT